MIFLPYLSSHAYLWMALITIIKKTTKKNRQIKHSRSIFHHKITIPFHTTNIFSFLSKLFSLVPKKISFVSSFSLNPNQKRSITKPIKNTKNYFLLFTNTYRCLQRTRPMYLLCQLARK